MTEGAARAAIELETLTDEPLRALLRAKGLERVKAFSWDRSVKAIHDGYLKALGRPVTALAAEPLR